MTHCPTRPGDPSLLTAAEALEGFQRGFEPESGATPSTDGGENDGGDGPLPYAPRVPSSRACAHGSVAVRFQAKPHLTALTSSLFPPFHACTHFAKGVSARFQ